MAVKLLVLQGGGVNVSFWANFMSAFSHFLLPSFQSVPVTMSSNDTDSKLHKMRYAEGNYDGQISVLGTSITEHSLLRSTPHTPHIGF